jgi:prepilin-type N-terminal cleavage/methylation domain-containing protein
MRQRADLMTSSPGSNDINFMKRRSVRRFRAFTLLEMLVVMAIIAILLVAVVPALTTIKTAGGVTNAAYTIKDALEQARTYAMANNTYVWVGFYEEATTAAVPTNTAPPYSGTGRVVIGVVYSRDGTKIFDSSDPTAPLPPSSINSLGKLLKIEGIHLTDIGSPSGGSPDNLDGRSDWPYTYAAGISADHFNRISSTSADKTKFNFTTQNYTFYKTVRFDPRGEANLNSTYSLKNVAEIGIRPTHGNAIDANTRNVVAIQFAGIAGNFKIYRR